MNYLLSFTLILSPWLFDFSHVGGASLFLPIIIGWLQFIMAVFSNNSHGFLKVFPMEMHLFLDVIVGSFLLASPFVYGFSGEVVWPQVILGGLLCIMGIATKKSPYTTPHEDRLPEGQLGSVDSE